MVNFGLCEGMQYFVLTSSHSFPAGDVYENIEGAKGGAAGNDMIYSNTGNPSSQQKPADADRGQRVSFCSLSLRNALRWGYSNAAVVPSVRGWTL